MNTIILIGAMTALYAGGGVLIAHAAKESAPVSLAAAYVALTAANLLYLTLIKAQGLAVAATMSNAALLIATVLAARVFFGELITTRMILGLGCAAAAIILVAPPSIWKS